MQNKMDCDCCPHWGCEGVGEQASEKSLAQWLKAQVTGSVDLLAAVALERLNMSWTFLLLQEVTRENGWKACRAGPTSWIWSTAFANHVQWDETSGVWQYCCIASKTSWSENSQPAHQTSGTRGIFSTFLWPHQSPRQLLKLSAELAVGWPRQQLVVFAQRSHPSCSPSPSPSPPRHTHHTAEGWLYWALLAALTQGWMENEFCKHCQRRVDIIYLVQ